MEEQNVKKIKLLKLVEILRAETDEQNPMLATDVCKRLANNGIIVHRRVLTRDIDILNEFGYEIMSTLIGHERAYYVIDRSFSVPELKILIDAVQAATFITEKKTPELVEKIAALGGSHRAEIMQENIVCFNTRKHSNESIYYNVDCLENAIQNNKRVIFLYYDLDEHGEKVYRRDGHHYVVEPIALVFNDDNYYLSCYSAKHDGTANYRVDRMTAVESIDEEISEKAQELRGEMGCYTEQVFRMYGGDIENVTLELDDKLIGVIYDKFGEETKIIRTGETTVAASVKVQISPTFFGWLFQFGNQMKVLSPSSVANDYKKQAKAVLTE
ncbi:MAG: WYL domain-containing transcriptional regulator [Ruminococcaceae bacterium]|nr:WYL domain-containing transcriptional regulator [Oscillospiraceae bacterium]